jgi:hypothetical protein
MVSIMETLFAVEIPYFIPLIYFRFAFLGTMKHGVVAIRIR